MVSRFFQLLASPFNIAAVILSYIYIIHIRAMKLAHKRHIRLEYLEKGVVKK